LSYLQNFVDYISAAMKVKAGRMMQTKPEQKPYKSQQMEMGVLL